MERITLPTDERPDVVITAIEGDMRLTGWEQAQIVIEAESGEKIKAEQEGDRVAIICKADCVVRVPRSAALRIMQARGDVRVKALEGSLKIDHVDGDLSLRNVGAVAIGFVGGDLSAKKIDGSLEVGSAGGDISARTIAGDFRAATLHADLYLRDLSGGAVAKAMGDSIISIKFSPDRHYHFETGGDLLCRVAADESATFEVRAGGDVSVELAGAATGRHDEQDSIKVGGGVAQVKLVAGGDVSLTELAGDPAAMGDLGDQFGQEFGVMAEEFAARIESQIEAQMADLEKQLSQQLGHFNISLGTGKVRPEEIADKARRTAERAADLARRKAERATRRVEAKIDAARRRAERHAERAQRHEAHRGHAGQPGLWATWKWRGAPTPPTPPTPPAEPVSDEERMTILKMVEQGKISVAEAEKLLAALEGNS